MGGRFAMPHVRREMGWPDFYLLETGMATSRSEARRLVQQGAIRIDGEMASDPFVPPSPRETIVLSKGRRQFVRVRIEG